jgi:hypothetical protein
MIMAFLAYHKNPVMARCVIMEKTWAGTPPVSAGYPWEPQNGNG